MIHSIEFVKNKSGYLMKKEYQQVFREGVTREIYDSLSLHEKRMHNDKYIKNVYVGYENKLAKNCLIGKKINFNPFKITILFGPNGCGKSTIIKSLASHALCGKSPNHDGWTNLTHFEPLNLKSLNTVGGSYTLDSVSNAIDKECGNNTVNIKWDGMPVFFSDIENMKRHGAIGDLAGGTLPSINDEVSFIMNSNISSKGEISSYILSNIVDRMKNILTIDGLIEQYNEYLKYNQLNDTWKECYNIQYDYYMNILNNVKRQNFEMATFLFDEIDKSMDIKNIYLLYSQILPSLQEKYGVQIITVSHSPFVLSNIIYNNPKYNVISLDKKYTNEVFNIISNMDFN